MAARSFDSRVSEPPFAASSACGPPFDGALPFFPLRERRPCLSPFIVPVGLLGMTALHPLADSDLRSYPRIVAMARPPAEGKSRAEAHCHTCISATAANSGVHVPRVLSRRVAAELLATWS